MEHLEQHPNLAWRVPGGNDYAIGDSWQGRAEIGLLVEVMGSRHRAALVDRLLQAMREGGARLVMISPDEEDRALGFYQQNGWTCREEVILYRRPQRPVPALPHRLSLFTLTPERLPDLLALEEAAFPWLWRYGAPIFQAAATTPDRRLSLGYLGGDLVGYLIYTLHGEFGHVDRLAVHPRYQAQDYGAELLAHVLREMAAHGATSAGLSTQKENHRSQRLYEGFDFRRTGEKYRMYGKWLT